MSNPPAADDDGPTLGTMFRLIHSAMLQEYARWLATTQYHDFKPAYAAIMRARRNCHCLLQNTGEAMRQAGMASARWMP